MKKSSLIFLFFFLQTSQINAEIFQLADGLIIDTSTVTTRIARGNECGPNYNPDWECELSCYEGVNEEASVYSCKVGMTALYFEEFLEPLMSEIQKISYPTGNSLETFDLRSVIFYPYQRIRLCFNLGKPLTTQSINWVLAAGYPKVKVDPDNPPCMEVAGGTPPICDGSVDPLPVACCDGTVTPRPPLCDPEPPVDCSEPGAGDPGECTDICESTPDPLPGYCCDGTVSPTPDNCPLPPVCDGSEWPLPAPCCDDTNPENAPLCDLQCDGSVKPLPIECCNDTIPGNTPLCNLKCDGSIKPLPVECCDGTFPETAPLCDLKCDGTEVPEPPQCCDGTIEPIPDICVTIPLELDPLYPDAWHLENTGQSNHAFRGGTPGVDLKVKPVIERGIRGDGIKVGVSDTGIEFDHEDLDDNYSSPGSKNFYLDEPFDGDPITGGDSSSDAHGTLVTGIIAALGGNNIGSRGVAPNAEFGGFNYLAPGILQDIFKTLYQMDGPFDVFNYSYGVKTCSYNTMIYRSSIINAYENGVNNLRNGKGALYVKAAGNDFESNPGFCTSQTPWFNPYLGNANFDENNNYIYTIITGAMTATGIRSSYSTPGSNLWVTAPGGEFGSIDPAIMSSDLSGCDAGKANSSASGSFENGNDPTNPDCNYSSRMNGTSSAAPNTAGVIALILDANPNLTWRDVKHILATTSTLIDFPSGPYNHPQGRNLAGHIYQYGWVENAAGYNYHNFYGFGLPNAEVAVTAALNYNTDLGELVETGRWNISSGTLDLAIPNEDSNGATDSITVNQNLIIEAVQIRVNISHEYIDNIGIQLFSPSGTKSIILNINSANVDNDLINATFLTNAFYGESSTGNWFIRVIDGSDQNPDGTNGTDGTFVNWSINISGHIPSTPLKSLQSPAKNVRLSRNRTIKKPRPYKIYQTKMSAQEDRHSTPADPFLIKKNRDFYWSPNIFAIYQKDYSGPVDQILGDLLGLKIINTDLQPIDSYYVVKSRKTNRVGIYTGSIVLFGKESDIEPELQRRSLIWKKVLGSYIISIDNFDNAYNMSRYLKNAIKNCSVDLSIIYSQIQAN